MKALLSTILCAFVINVCAQNSKPVAGIFGLGVKANEEFVTSVSYSGGLLGGVSTPEGFPPELTDSSKALTLKMMEDYLQMPVEFGL